MSGGDGAARSCCSYIPPSDGVILHGDFVTLHGENLEGTTVPPGRGRAHRQPLISAWAKLSHCGRVILDQFPGARGRWVRPARPGSLFYWAIGGDQVNSGPPRIRLCRARARGVRTAPHRRRPHRAPRQPMTESAGVLVHPLRATHRVGAGAAHSSAAHPSGLPVKSSTASLMSADRSQDNRSEETQLSAWQ